MILRLESLPQNTEIVRLHVLYTHVQWKRTTLQMRIIVAYPKLCKIVLFIIII